MNAELLGQVVRIPSGTGILSGTVTRTTDASIWVTFPGLAPVRFVKSQDGGFRRYGRSTEQASPVLTFPRNLTGQPEMIQAALDAEAGAEGGFHGKVYLTGKQHAYPDGERWYEVEWDSYEDFPSGKAWVSWDAPLDHRAPEPATPTALTGWQDELSWV